MIQIERSEGDIQFKFRSKHSLTAILLHQHISKPSIYIDKCGEDNGTGRIGSLGSSGRSHFEMLGYSVHSLFFAGEFTVQLLKINQTKEPG